MTPIVRLALDEDIGASDVTTEVCVPADRRARGRFLARERLVIAGLEVLGELYDELALHVKAALRNGLTPDEIKEVLLQTAIYCGVPAANSAFAVAQRALDEAEARGQ